MFLPPFFIKNEVSLVITMVLLRVLILILLFVAAISPYSQAFAGDGQVVSSPELISLIDNGGYAVKKEGRIITAYNLHKMFVPASILKIATSLAAIKVLGPQYRFATYFFLDANQNLYIKGYGDPFLISEEVASIVRRLKELGCERINDIYLDDTAFAIAGSADGAGLSDNPYDAQNSALAVNFNTININKVSDGNVRSAEEQTPLLPLMIELAKDLEPGVHRINISQGREKGPETAKRYAGELFRAFQHEENIAGNGTIAHGNTPENLPPYYIHKSSKRLVDIIAPLMLYSNNFIANQLYLAVGAALHQYPATWEKSRKAVAGILQDEFNLSANEVRIFEGSGLSRKNLASPNAMIQLLDLFKPFSASLPQEHGKILKSGTLKGVYSYAGYFTEEEKADSVVVILNQKINHRDRVLLLLEKMYRER
jgi:D-alanyl-D-alanine carboxypeptidase/D-alanyl-D-alanine-endopeptidase (penicillin-binding protein 4)